MYLRFDVLLLIDYQNFRICNLDYRIQNIKKGVCILYLAIQKKTF